MELAIQIFQFVLSISILVILHELGHFLPAKWFKTKVEKFYLFFDPWFSLVKKKIGETEYGIGWLPLGGYVKIAGMIDESMDTEQMSKPAEPWEFRSKPAWQRLIIMLGGVTVNFFLAWFIFSSLNYFKGERVFDMDNKIDIHYTELAKEMGFQNGDKILKVDGKIQNNLDKLSLDILLGSNVTVMRNGKEVTFDIKDEGKAAVMKQETPKNFLIPRMEAVVDTIILKSTIDSGLKIGDKIIKINGETITYFDEIAPKLQQLKNKTASINIERQGKIHTLSIPISENGTIGFSSHKQLSKFITHKEYSLLESFNRGFTMTIESLTYQIKQFKVIFNEKIQGYKKVSGPIGIVKNMPTQFDWEKFWHFTATFSVWLAFLNLLPIPGLDGGHVLFTLWEMITGKPASQKILEIAQMAGVIFLLGLMVLIFGHDIYKLF